MKKITATILSLLTFTAATVLTAGLCAQNQPLTTSAETVNTGEKLLLPFSYEEYLSLNAPSDGAVCDEYIAIADGKTVFLFNREQNAWQKYVHTSPVTKLHFGRRNELYFLDGQTNALFLLTIKNGTATAVATGVVCSTFTVRGDFLYYANTSAGQTWIRFAPLSDLSTYTELYNEKNYCPALSYWNGEIYFMYGTNYLHRLSPDTKQATGIGALPSGVTSMLIADGAVYCTTAEGYFYGYSLEEFSSKKDYADCAPIAEYDGNFSALSAYGSYLYLVEGDSLRQYSLTKNQFTDYEISAASDAQNRLSGGSEIHLFEDKLFIADDGNDRISVYDTKAQTFLSPIANTLDAPYLASCGETLLAADDEQAILYSLSNDNYGDIVAALEKSFVSGKIVGATCVYGNYYIVTDENRCYIPEPTETGYTWTEINRKTHRADGLTSDADGFLYVRNGDSVYRYTESTFNDSVEAGVKLFSDLPVSTSKFSVDYRGNVYALAENRLLRYDKNEDGSYTKGAEKSFSASFVYEVAPQAKSFTFGVEENAVYTLYEENYLTVTDEFSLPTVKTIPTQGVNDELFSDNVADFSIVTTKAQALLVEFDLTKTANEPVFSYLRHFRQEEQITALKVGQTENYTVLAYRKDKASPYQTFLVANENYAAASDGELLDYAEAKSGYVTNAATLYKYPSMGLPTASPLVKDEKITLLGEVNGLDCDYYKVAYGERVGYIAKANVLPFSGAPLPTETTAFGDVEVNKDGIWRLTYLALGTGAICILVDFLILRKKDEDEE